MKKRTKERKKRRKEWRKKERKKEKNDLKNNDKNNEKNKEMNKKNVTYSLTGRKLETKSGTKIWKVAFSEIIEFEFDFFSASTTYIFNH